VEPRRRRRFLADLEHALPGGVRADPVHRAIYSTDASIYRVEPVAAVVPRSAIEAARAVSVAAAWGVPVTPRSGGTCLSGGAVGPGLVIDVSRNMDQILAVDADRLVARVQPGVVLDRLNAGLAPYGLMFGPDVATSSRACLGGMIGNNSSGARSIRYGKTVDHVIALEVVLADGSTLRVGPEVPERPAAAVARALAVARDHADEVRERYPDVLRNVAGYNLPALLVDAPNPAHLLVGSEGTLGLITEAEVGLVRRPQRTALGLVYFDDLARAMDSVPRILSTGPSAVELIDRMLVDLARESPEFGALSGVIAGSPEAVLVVEMQGDEAGDLEARLSHLEGTVLATREASRVDRITDAAGQASVWAVRKAGLGILSSMPGDSKPIAFVEDAALPPEELGRYVRAVRKVVRREGLEAAFYGHASAGCLHIRPVLDLRCGKDVARMERIASAVADLVRGLGGALSGEHGDGRVRSPYLERYYGSKLAGAFADVKAGFDPEGRFNPGVIVDPAPISSDLRAAGPRPAWAGPGWFSFSQHGGLMTAADRCNGNGACRKLEGGTMCPSYRATRDERHSTRGRANALRAALQGEVAGLDPSDPGLHEALSLCVSCKGCARECPTGVDMARLKAELLAAWHIDHGTSLREDLFGRWPEWARLLSLAPRLANLGLSLRPLRRMADLVLGLDPTKPLPMLARQTFRAWFERRRRPEPEARPPVLLFDDTFVNHHEPEVGQAAVAVLEAAGFSVRLPERRVCCGRTYLSKGLLDRARERAAEAVEMLAPAAEAGIPIVGLEPSCLLTFRDEVPDLVDDPRAHAVARAVSTLPELLAQRGESLALRPSSQRVLVHGHCHMKSLVGMEATARVLSRIEGLRYELADTTCCGMAGSFGYEAEHAAFSRRIAEQSFLPAIERAGEGAVLLMDGTSCRQQAAQLAGRKAVHLATFLQSLLA